MYKHNPDADISRTGSLTILEFPPIRLVERFGLPSASHDNKVAGIYIFTTDRGETFTVYNRRRTAPYRGEGSGVPNPNEFWRSEEPAFLYVGGGCGSNPGPFLKWLMGESELRMTRHNPTSKRHRGPSFQFGVA